LLTFSRLTEYSTALALMNTKGVFALRYEKVSESCGNLRARSLASMRASSSSDGPTAASRVFKSSSCKPSAFEASAAEV
jgi:hypothetical protein